MKTLKEIYFNEEKTNKILFHGSPENFDKFHQKEWVAFDGQKVTAPIWLSFDKNFAKLYAKGKNGTIYTIEANLNKTFPDKPLMKEEGNYYIPTDFGEELIDYFLETNAFGMDSEDYNSAEETLKEVDKLNYDVLETKTMFDWMKKNGYDSFEVRGDGPTNIAVFDANQLKIIKKEHNK